MVLGKNVSYDVYGTFCMKSERQIHVNRQLRFGWIQDKHFQESQVFPLVEVVWNLKPGLEVKALPNFKTGPLETR